VGRVWQAYVSNAWLVPPFGQQKKRVSFTGSEAKRALGIEKAAAKRLRGQ